MNVIEDLETKEEIITKIYGNYLYFINKQLEKSKKKQDMTRKQ